VPALCTLMIRSCNVTTSASSMAHVVMAGAVRVLVRATASVHRSQACTRSRSMTSRAKTPLTVSMKASTRNCTLHW
jgi:hypothetical protein